MNSNRKRFIVASIMLILAFMAGGIILVSSSISFIEINAIGLINYIEVENLNDGIVNTHRDINKTSTSIRVAKGSYRITVATDSSTNVFFSETSGFFSTSKLVTSEIPEANRYFLGEDPNKCGVELAGTLISFGCGGSIATLKTHTPSNGRIPTYVKKLKVADGDNGQIQGVVKLDDSRAVVLVRRPSRAGNMAPSQIFYELRLDNNYTPTLTYLVNADYLSPTVEHVFYQVNGQLVVHSLTGTALYIGLSINELRPFEIDLLPYASNLSRVDSIGSKYLLHLEKSKPILENRQPDMEETRFVVVENGNITHEKVLKGQSYIKATFCFAQYICAIDYENRLSVLDQEFNLIKKLGDAFGFIAREDSLLIHDKKGILVVPNNLTEGYYAYTQEGYSVSAIIGDSDLTPIIVINSSKSVSALVIDLTAPVSEHIDKQVQELRSSPYINAVAPYKNSIIVSPNLGELVYNPNTETLDYSQEVKSNVKNEIQSLMSLIGLNLDKYTIILNNLD